jgi:predicted nucleic acid-binding protein
LVVDASVVLAWCFADEQEPYAVAVLRLLESRTATVPSVWPLEVANALVVAERRGRLKPARTADLIAEIAKLGIEVDSRTSSQVWKETLTLARRYGLSVYDAAYLELAIRESVPLATLDQALAEVARRLKLPNLAV